MGPTGVGKTEIARRLARLTGAPFIKVEATKYTEVGYVGRDVESMIRDLMELGIKLVREEEHERVRAQAEEAAENRLLDLLLPGGGNESTREKLRQQWRMGYLDDREVEVEVKENGPQIDMFSMPGMEQLGSQMKSMMGRIAPPRTQKKRMKIRAAWNILLDQCMDGLLDEERIVDMARERVEQSGIVFIDEIDKIASSAATQRSSDISREGVQRDLLPIVEGSTVNTKHGMIRTDHILFIAARGLPLQQTVRSRAGASGPLSPPGGASAARQGGISAHPHRTGQFPSEAVQRPAFHGRRGTGIHAGGAGGNRGLCRGNQRAHGKYRRAPSVYHAEKSLRTSPSTPRTAGGRKSWWTRPMSTPIWKTCARTRI